MNTFNNLTEDEKLDLYNQSKEEYYGDGESPLSDLEFDELEAELGLENKGYVGTHHQKSYTIEHPFLMGSLSKVQIKEKDDHTIDWVDYQTQIDSYLKKSKFFMYPDWTCETTPKYDGCSWEIVISSAGELVSVSTRGDGQWGKDIKVWFENEWNRYYKPHIQEYFDRMDKQSYSFLDKLTVRGECLIKKSVFMNRYSSEFALPRSFVAGVFGQEWEGTEAQNVMRDDLSWIAYDFREVYTDGSVKEVDYINKKLNLGHVPELIAVMHDHSINYLYKLFEEYRKECEFALDGFVIKPGVQYRLQDGDRTRQEDCVAVKFLPEIVEATLKDIEWNVGKTGEYYPKGILEPVELGGKEVKRVSLSNYGKVIDNHIGPGSRLKISLAGDIIPFVYDVISEGGPVSIPADTYVDDVHLMKIITDEDRQFIKFINSVNVLKPDGIGEKVAQRLYELFPTDNILNFMSDGGISIIEEGLEESKTKENIIASLRERRKTLNLQDTIQSMGYESCGEKNALWLAKVFSGLNPDTKGIPSAIIDLSTDDEFLYNVERYEKNFGLALLVEEAVGDRIPVIMTGSPKERGFATKADFLAQHPEYIETTSWKDCKILFTDDLNSSSSKMSKAKKMGIEIKVYE